MHTLRTSRFFGLNLARLVLVWFVLSVGVAVAAPLLYPKAMDIVCTGSGAAKLVIKSADGTTGTQALDVGMDCPMCAPAGAPPTSVCGATPQPSPLSHALRPIEQAVLAAIAAAPPPARGPPPIS